MRIAQILRIPVLVALIALGGLTFPAAASPGLAIDCSQCHYCETPTEASPCLRGCPRPGAMKSFSPDQGPDVVILGDLENLFGPTRFNHKAHAEMAAMGGGCGTCHHNSPNPDSHPACKTCHTDEIAKEDLGQPGLRGIFHRSCLKCHADWNKDTGCENCHAKKQADGTFPALQPIGSDMGTSTTTVKDLMIFETNYKPGDKVPFHHRRHTTTFGYSCAECHEKEGCKACHGPDGVNTSANGHHKESMRLCFECHGQNSCDHCHGRDPNSLFAHPDVSSLRKDVFEKMTCRSCHGHAGPYKRTKADTIPGHTPLPTSTPDVSGSAGESGGAAKKAGGGR